MRDSAVRSLLPLDWGILTSASDRIHRPGQTCTGRPVTPPFPLPSACAFRIRVVQNGLAGKVGRLFCLPPSQRQIDERKNRNHKQYQSNDHFARRFKHGMLLLKRPAIGRHALWGPGFSRMEGDEACRPPRQSGNLRQRHPNRTPDSRFRHANSLPQGRGALTETELPAQQSRVRGLPNRAFVSRLARVARGG